MYAARDTLLVFEVHHLIGIAPEDDVASGIGVDLVPTVGHAFGNDGDIPGFDILQDTATNLSAVIGAESPSALYSLLTNSPPVTIVSVPETM